MQKGTPCLRLDDQAEQAAEFYASIFKRSRITGISYYGEGAPRAKGSVLTVTFTLDGQEFVALNGGPIFKFTEAISLMVNCSTQKELDAMWAKLSEGGQEVQCGWLKDKYGLFWQIVPAKLGKMMRDKDRAKRGRVMEAVLQMKKPDIAALEKAYRGR